MSIVDELLAYIQGKGYTASETVPDDEFHEEQKWAVRVIKALPDGTFFQARLSFSSVSKDTLFEATDYFLRRFDTLFAEDVALAERRGM